MTQRETQMEMQREAETKERQTEKFLKMMYTCQ